MKYATQIELRDHAEELLLVIAEDLETAQSEDESISKSKGLATRTSVESIAETHASHRFAAGFNSEQIMVEFRALRSSVLRLWLRKTNNVALNELQDMVRFNEAIDQAQSESMARYTKILLESQNLFLSILGHDVKNPLHAISMGAQVLLQDTTLPSKALKIGLRIYNNARRMYEIVRDLLDFSTSHLGGGIPINPHSVDLYEICQNVVDEALTVHAGRKIELETSGALEGTWDGPRMAQAIANLINNAVQHGFPDAVIKVTMHGLESEVNCTVQNAAAVIPEPKLRYLFDPAKRFAIRSADERASARIENLGLGLYIVKEIICAHGGEVKAESSADDGVTITMSLPRVTPHRRIED